jgi:hypothetical protein
MLMAMAAGLLLAACSGKDGAVAVSSGVTEKSTTKQTVDASCPADLVAVVTRGFASLSFMKAAGWEVASRSGTVTDLVPSGLEQFVSPCTVVMTAADPKSVKSQTWVWAFATGQLDVPGLRAHLASAGFTMLLNDPDNWTNAKPGGPRHWTTVMIAPSGVEPLYPNWVYQVTSQTVVEE